MTNRESLVAALEEAGYPSTCRDGECMECDDIRGAMATEAPALLPLLLAHASPEARAAALRGLLGERLDEDGVMDALSDAHADGFPSKHWVRNILAPAPPTGGTAE